MEPPSTSTTAALVGTLAEYRDFADTLVQIRAAKGSAAAAAPLTAACAAAGTALLLRARELERGALLAAQGLKDASGEQRGRLDHDALALHNLVYEQQYYDKEIASCRAFRSAVAEEQIGSDAPPCGASHDAELARLTAELQARKALKAQLASLEARRAAEQERRASAQALVDDLRSHLTAVSASSKPLLDRSLPAGGGGLKDDREAAELLPLPLYIIYSQAATAASIVGLPLRVGVQGSVAAAQQEQQQQQGDGQAQQQQGASAQDAKRRRKSVQQGDKTYKMHPLSVTLEVHQAGDSGVTRQLVAALTFSYYTQLQLVGVAAGSSDDEALFTHLFLGDVGDGQLLEAVAACSSSGTLQFAEAGRPRPFRWAQELGGVDVLASLPSSLTGIGSDRSQVLSALAAYRSKLRLETLLERLVAAKAGRRQLKRILEQLAKREQPASSASARVVSKISTDITAWKHLGDVGMQQAAASLFGQAAGRPQALAAWRQAGQAVSIAEEGEVAGEGEEVSQLQHGDTAEEVLLMGLLDEARPAQQEGGGPAAAAAAEVLLLEPGDAGLEEGEHLEEAVADMEAGGEPSAPDSELLLPAEGDGAPGGRGGDSASAGGQALLASHSLYRLVCRTGALEVHLHVMVFHSYPLCPPVFQVTKLLDLRPKDGPTPLADVNKVLALQQQVNDAAVKAAMAADAGELLAVQVLQLRQCIDLLSAHMRGAHSKDLVDNLRAKQHLQGRERQPRLVGC